MANLQKIIGLIKKTGDKVIILDENGDPGFILMSAGDYEDLILGRSGVQGLTEEELLDKINRDIAVWKDNQQAREMPIDQYDFAKDIGEVSNEDYLSKFGENDFRSAGSIDEERYYFEPVEN